MFKNELRCAVLECDHFKPHVKSASESKLERYGDYLPVWLEQTNLKLRWTLYNVLEGEWPKNVDDHDVYFVPGSAYNVSENKPWMLELASFLRIAHASNKKLLGVCFGHQVIAHALGGSEGPHPPFNFGVDEITFSLSPDIERLWGESSSSFSKPFFVSHGQQVIKPPPFTRVVAKGPRCPVFVYTDGHQVLATQGHPEFSSLLMDKLATKLCGDGLIAKENLGAIQSELTREDVSHTNTWFAAITAKWLTTPVQTKSKL